jgi:predicted RNase H-like HicB family nuclease
LPSRPRPRDRFPHSGFLPVDSRGKNRGDETSKGLLAAFRGFPFPFTIRIAFAGFILYTQSTPRSGEMTLQQSTAIIDREDDGFTALCPELDIASQGDTIEDAQKNLQEDLELFFEFASSEEAETRLHKETFFV